MKPIASLSLDLDNQWSYMKTHGDSGWDAYPSYLDRLADVALPLLDQLGLRITFFVVGTDAERAENREALGRLVQAGHEIGNHSHRHEPWMHHYSLGEVASELSRAEDAIEGVTGVRPNGFRGPGYSLSSTVLGELARRRYLYDASTFPTWIGPVARAYYFLTARLDAREQADRSELFGSVRDALRPIAPYRWRLREGSLLEIPVTTMPGFRVPIHLSYVMFLATHSESLANLYFRSALAICRMAGIAPSLLLHPLDFLGSDEVSALAFFPGMHLRGERKREVTGRALQGLASSFRVVSMGNLAELLAARDDLRWCNPI